MKLTGSPPATALVNGSGVLRVFVGSTGDTGFPVPSLRPGRWSVKGIRVGVAVKSASKSKRAPAIQHFNAHLIP